jgi:hypothetical protein
VFEIKPQFTSLLVDNESDIYYNSYGSIRINLIRKHFGLETKTIGSYLNKNSNKLKLINARIQRRRLTETDLETITSLYVEWRDKREFLPLCLFYRNNILVDCNDIGTTPEKYIDFVFKYTGKKVTAVGDIVSISGERFEWAFPESIKRGNKPYVELIRERFEKEFFSKPPIEFFSDIQGDKKTKMLYLTGTTDPKQYEIGEAWLHFGIYWNTFITNLRQKYGSIVYIRTWQSQENGYPHFHSLVYFEDKEFTAVNWINADGSKSYRLPSRSGDRKKIKDCWKQGNLDIVCVQDAHKSFKDMLKYVIRDLEGGESDLTNAMLTYFGKQAFSYSDKFSSLVWGNDTVVALHEPCNADLINSICSNSNSELLRIEVFPILPQSFFKFDVESDKDPPNEFEYYIACLKERNPPSEHTSKNGIKVCVYKDRN